MLPPQEETTSLVPLLEEHTPFVFCPDCRCIRVTAESFDVKIAPHEPKPWPPHELVLTTAVSNVPSPEKVIALHILLRFRCIHVAPESSEV